MIGEFIRYATTFAPERVRKFGYLQRLIALEFRAKRCAEAWAPHQRRARSFIVKAADLCERHNLAVIIGSGLLLEVPLKALAERFERVYLVDIFHMPQVRREAKRYFNVKLLTGDVTGVFAAMKEHRPPGPNIPAPPARLPNLKDADLIVSCNCLTQLAGPFNAYFEKERGFGELDSDKLAYQVMENHAKAVAVEATGIGVLITDTERFAMQRRQGGVAGRSVEGAAPAAVRTGLACAQRGMGLADRAASRRSSDPRLCAHGRRAHLPARRGRRQNRPKTTLRPSRMLPIPGRTRSAGTGDRDPPTIPTRIRSRRYHSPKVALGKSGYRFRARSRPSQASRSAEQRERHGARGRRRAGRWSR